jgi:hypothetical protein
MVNDEGLKGISRTLDNCLLSFDKVENIDSIPGLMECWTRKPVPARFDKLQLVEPSTLFLPSWTFRNRFYSINQVLSDPIGVAIPGDVSTPGSI